MNVPLRASDLVAAIQEFIAEHGDLPLAAEYDTTGPPYPPHYDDCYGVECDPVDGRLVVSFLSEEFVEEQS